MKNYTGIDGYLKLTQIREVVNSEFFRAFVSDFFQTVKLSAKKGTINEDIRSVGIRLKKLTSDSTGQSIPINTVLSNINKAIEMNKTKIKQATRQQKQWDSTWRYGIGLGFAFPVLDALFLNGGELAIPLLVFSLVATTALAASILYGCGKRILKLKEFDQIERDLGGYIENDFAEYFDRVMIRAGTTPALKLESYVQRFKLNPGNSPLPLTMKETIAHALNLRAQGEAMGR